MDDQSTLDKLDPASPEHMLASVLYEIQCINGQLAEMRIVLARVMPLVTYAEQMLNTTPTQRLREALRKR